MKSIDCALDFLECQDQWRYHPRTAPAAEPTAWAAIALAAYGREESAARASEWLRNSQNADGSVGIRRGETTPGWPTSLAVLAWNATDRLPNANSSRAETESPALPSTNSSRRAIDWLLAISGDTSERPAYTGHDTTIPGWPWVAGTHSWVEPTALSLLALRSAGLENHPRAQDAARLLNDRLLPTGGSNYGNTIVLGQTLLPHVEPTGLTLLALAGQDHTRGRIAATLAYLDGALSNDTTPASLAYGLLGLAAWNRIPAGAEDWIDTCAAQSYRRSSAYELSLLALAVLGRECPLISLLQGSAAV